MRIENQYKARKILLDNYIRIKNEIIRQVMSKKVYGFNKQYRTNELYKDMFENTLDDTIYNFRIFNKDDRTRFDKSQIQNYFNNKLDEVEDDLSYQKIIDYYFPITNIRYFRIRNKGYDTIDDLINDYLRYYFNNKGIKNRTIHELVYLKFQSRLQNKIAERPEVNVYQLEREDYRFSTESVNNKLQNEALRNLFKTFFNTYLSKTEKVLYNGIIKGTSIKELSFQLYKSENTISSKINFLRWKLAIFMICYDSSYDTTNYMILSEINKNQYFRVYNLKYFGQENLTIKPTLNQADTLLLRLKEKNKTEKAIIKPDYKTVNDYEKENINFNSLQGLEYVGRNNIEYQSKFDLNNKKHKHYCLYILRTWNNSYKVIDHVNKVQKYVNMNQ